MTREILFLSAGLYWLNLILRFFMLIKPSTTLEKSVSIAEKIALVGFTFGLVFYITGLRIVNGELHAEFYDRPVSWLLFAWSINAAHLATEIAYGNKATSWFANLYTAMALTLSPHFGGVYRNVFNSDLEWLSFHRLCFLLGYAFCVLAFPLSLQYLRAYRGRNRASEEERASWDRKLWTVDRLVYRMILWAMPLLSAGIITECLFLLEAHRLPGPAQIFAEHRETFLALAAWCICGIYLHARLFYGWTKLRSTALYMSGFLLLMAGHFTHSLWGKA